MGSRHEKDKDKGVNVQVLLRCRPFSEEEIRSNAPQVISCYDQRREVTVCQNIASKQIDRTFTFDKVFGPQSQQKDLYDQAVVPIVHEMLEGFNCTIFAYGQTGTGKTYTMEGTGRKTKNGELPADAGVIPRSVQQIFDTLESQNAEYSVKVTFLELYNEEITDLLAPDDFSKLMDDKQRKPLALMEDGKGGVLVRGLEEEIVTSASEIYTLLDRGSAKRRTAETLLNKQSSRSHSIFSITIHIKEATPEGEELIKCGKLNLVDLAGSENISRSGAREGRAREAGEINKSLLTLGRVITALVEHLAHVPYRDSKLTRLLRDSLGGRTKTCIIATVSPSVHCLDETLSTLDYAHRAKNIRNKPEVNQKMMKSALIKDLYGEIDRLKAEVFAAREKNGIYVPRERFFQDEADKKAMSERIEAMEYEIEAKDKQLDELQELCDMQRQQHTDLSNKLDATQKALEQCQEALLEAKDNIKQAQFTVKEQEFVISAQQQAENNLARQTAGLRCELESTVQDVAGLFAKLERKDKIESGNRKLVHSFQGSLAQQMQVLQDMMVGSVAAQQKLLATMELQLQSFLSSKDQSVEEFKLKLDSLKRTYCTQIQGLQDVVHAHEGVSSSTLQSVHASVSSHASTLDELLAKSVSEAESILTNLQSTLCDQQKEIAVFAQQQREAAARSVQSTRNISEVVLNSLQTLQKSSNEFADFMEAKICAHDSSLAELADAYEEEAKQEKTLLLEGIADMLSSSMSRKVELVHGRVKRLRENSSSDSLELKQGVASFHDVAVAAQGHLESFVKLAEEDAVEASSVLAAKHCRLEDLLQHCGKYTSSAGEHWKTTQESLQQFERNHVPVVAAFVTDGLEANQYLTTRCKEVGKLAQSDIEAKSSQTLAFINDTRDKEYDAAAGLQEILEQQSRGTALFQSSHNANVAEIQRFADQSLKHDYLEDEETASTPKKRAVEVPSQAAINAMRMPAIETLQQEFRLKTTPPDFEGRSKYNPREVKVIGADLGLRDFRIPLTAIN